MVKIMGRLINNLNVESSYSFSHIGWININLTFINTGVTSQMKRYSLMTLNICSADFDL